MIFLKDKVLKSEGRISHKQDALFINHIFPFKNHRKHLPWCSFHDPGVLILSNEYMNVYWLRAYTDAHSDLGHQSFTCDRKPFLDNIACAIRHFLNNINLTKYARF